MKLLTILAVLLPVLSVVKANVLPQFSQAGFNSTSRSRVVGGHEAIPHQAPFIVSFRQEDDHFCAGTIINKFWILSAAHCFLDVYKVTAVAGIHLYNDEGQRRLVERYVGHENYSGRVGPFDISLVKVEVAFEFNTFVQPVILPAPDVVPTGTVELFGWGSISDSYELELPEALHTVAKPIISYDDCKDALADLDKPKLATTNLCTGPLTSGGISACIRDSGGSLVQKQMRGGYELVGIVSWGYFPCGLEAKPSIYTRVSAYIDWMYKVLYN